MGYNRRPCLLTRNVMNSEFSSQFLTLSVSHPEDQPLVYLDSAATTQKPQAVIDAMVHHDNNRHANVHRGAHYLADIATSAFEMARHTVQRFINAAHRHEIIWTRGTTEAINLVANSWGDANLNAGDLIVLATSEHHANIVPWQLLSMRTGARIEAVKLDEHHRFDMAHYQTLLDKKPKLVAVGHVSNALGHINPVADIISQAKAVGATTLIDGAQAVAHLNVDVQALDCDFYAFSGHKLYGPTGIGVLYGKQAILEPMPPWQGGGEMIDKVSFEQTTFNDLPYRFEAGTPNITGAIGLAAAVDFVSSLNRDALSRHELQVFHKLYDWLARHPQIELYSERDDNVGIVSFNVKDEHHQDIGVLLDKQGIAVRTGHHCAMPLMSALGVKGTVRASLACYNTEADIDAFIQAMEKVLDLLEILNEE